MVADGLEAVIQAHVLAHAGVVGEHPVRAGERGDEALPLLVARGGGPGALVVLEAPAGAAQQRPERVVARVATAEEAQERLVAHVLPHPFGVGEHGV